MFASSEQVDQVGARVFDEHFSSPACSKARNAAEGTSHWNEGKHNFYEKLDEREIF